MHIQPNVREIHPGDSVLAKHAAEIHRLGKRVVADAVEIGRHLSECKDICGHGNWLPWLAREFGWTDKTAENFINVHKLSGKFENFSNLDLPLSGLYLLAAPGTPLKARDEIIERAQNGETPSVAEIKDTIDTAKDRQPAKRRCPGDDEQWRSRRVKKCGRKTEVVVATETDIGPESAGEMARKDARIEELQAQLRHFEFQNIALRSEIAELKARLVAAERPAETADDGFYIPPLLRRTAP